jgi:hypothetical protein
LLDPFHPKETVRCLNQTGTVPDVVADISMWWYCSTKGYAGGLNKPADKPWTVLYVEPGTSEGRNATVKTVWR